MDENGAGGEKRHRCPERQRGPGELGRKEAENALEAQQQFLQAVLDNVEAGIVACDENGTLKLFNHAARAFHGRPLNRSYAMKAKARAYEAAKPR